MDPVSAAAGLENETCPQDLADVVVALRQGRLLGPELTGLAIGILREQQFVAGLPAFLPADTVSASKTGDLPGLRADVALVERGERWVVVAVVADELADEQADDRAGGGAPEARDRGTDVLPIFARIGELAAERLGRDG